MRFTDAEILYLKGLGLNFNYSKLSDDDLVRIEEMVGDRLVQAGFDEKYETNSEGDICEQIITKLTSEG